jgi:hypothetical protein
MDRFLLDGKERLLYKIRDNMIIPYIKLLFHDNYIERRYNQFGYLSHPSFINLLETRV